MRLLLDTHVLMWAFTRSNALSRKGWDLLEDDHELFVSAVSIWEIAIKHARRRRPADMPISGRQALANVQAADFELIAITPEHAAAVDGLPMHHNDPFDRLLVAQAQSESMHLVTHDRALAAYGDFVLGV